MPNKADEKTGSQSSRVVLVNSTKDLASSLSWVTSKAKRKTQQFESWPNLILWLSC